MRQLLWGICIGVLGTALAGAVYLRPQPKAAGIQPAGPAAQLRLRSEQQGTLAGKGALPQAARVPAPDGSGQPVVRPVEVPVRGTLKTRLRDERTGTTLAEVERPIAGTTAVRLGPEEIAVSTQFEDTAEIAVRLPERPWSVSLGPDGAELKWTRRLGDRCFLSLGAEREFGEGWRAKLRVGVEF
ncbi:hypothetical protein EDC14_100185 [Hydrogenispora ethanolica]|uniref:Uncharacterized protein n=1 Tax=Hydrogenispora ethanolica TaxID=1082276 RepID=A0A4R1SB87_HYDET|nr:hypothetical protein [Hydrogenispora ethanolica]TCL76803.1 hypothetical protein EDC14_100185 [Hydrogenispora ethanolica]